MTTKSHIIYVGMCLLSVHLFASSQAYTVQPTAAATPASYNKEEKSPCVCAVELPPVIVCTDYEAQENAAKLKVIQQQFSKLTIDVEQLQVESAELQVLTSSFRGKLAEVTTTFEQIEAGRILVTRSLLEDIRGGIRKLEEFMREWQAYGTVNSELQQAGQIYRVLQELSDVNQTLALMEAQGTSESLPVVQQRIASLSNQLESCRAQKSGDAADQSPTIRPDNPVTMARQTTVTAHVAATVATPTDTADMDTLPEKWPPRKRKQNSCGRLVRVMEPYTVRDNLGLGTWMRDPIVETDTVYFQSFSSNTGQLSMGTSVKAFQRSDTSTVSLSTVTYLKDSVMFNGSMYAYSGDTSTSASSQHYYGSRNRHTPMPPTLHKIDRSKLGESSRPVATTSSIDVRRVISSSDLQLDATAYQASSTVPKADLTVDESGVWVVYGDSQGRLSVARLDPDSLDIQQTWEGSFPKSLLGNCFVVCGRVYCVDKSSGFDARLSYYMDTMTRTEGFAGIPIMLKYGSLSSLEYNPADQLLYGIDDGHAVIYELVFAD